MRSTRFHLVAATAVLAVAGATLAGATVSGAIGLGSSSRPGAHLGRPAVARAHRPVTRDLAKVTSTKAKAMCGTTTKAPAYKHVIVIMFENKAYGTIYKQSDDPYINSVISKCGLATNYHNVTHFSLPNYIALTDGMTVAQLHPYIGDCSPSPGCLVSASQNNIYNEVAAHGGWKGYAESMPGNCSKSNSGNYAPRHNPAVYYQDLNSSCSKFDVPLGTTSNSRLLKDFSSQTTAPAYAFVTPNLMDDMHNGTVAQGDNWLKTWLPLITGTHVYQSGNTVIFITWDEGEPASGSPTAGYNCVNSSNVDCHVVTIVVAPSVKPGTKSSANFSHYSLLKTTEQLLGVAQLDSAKGAKSMISAFNL